jgi:hypothetical protein
LPSVSILALQDDILPAVRECRGKRDEKLAVANVAGPALNRTAIARIFPPHGIRNPFTVCPSGHREHLACAREVGPEFSYVPVSFPSASIDSITNRAWSLIHIVRGASDWAPTAAGNASKPVHKAISRSDDNGLLPKTNPFLGI